MGPPEPPLPLCAQPPSSSALVWTLDLRPQSSSHSWGFAGGRKPLDFLGTSGTCPQNPAPEFHPLSPHPSPFPSNTSSRLRLWPLFPRGFSYPWYGSSSLVMLGDHLFPLVSTHSRMQGPSLSPSPRPEILCLSTAGGSSAWGPAHRSANGKILAVCRGAVGGG